MGDLYRVIDTESVLSGTFAEHLIGEDNIIRHESDSALDMLQCKVRGGFYAWIRRENLSLKVGGT
jgi:hypothetical protein